MIYQEPKIAGVIGYPIQHSISPYIFEFLSQKFDIPLIYKRIPVKREKLGEAVSLFKDLDLFCGWNVTLPHKQQILPHLDMLSDEAKKLGAVNVIEFTKEGLKGHNTDIFGISQTFHEYDVDALQGSSVIFGAGGAALSVGFVLGQKKAPHVCFVGRREEQVRGAVLKMSEIFPQTLFTYQILEHSNSSLKKTLENAALLINATPLGMDGFEYRELLPEKIGSHSVVFDLIYRPKYTPFLNSAKSKGIEKIIGGLDMLVWQALATWEIWLSPIQDLAVTKSEVLKIISKKVIL